MTPGTFPQNRFIPDRIIALGIPVAPVKHLSPFGSSLGEFPGAAGLRTTDPGFPAFHVSIERVRVFAARISAASQKRAEFTLSDYHGLSTLLAHLIRGFPGWAFFHLNATIFGPRVIAGIPALRVTAAG